MKFSANVVLFTALWCILLVIPRTACAEATPPGPFEQAATITIPAGYSELLGAYDRSLGKEPVKALKEISKKLDKYNKIISRFAAVLDVGGKLYAGDLKGAAQSGALTALGELASTKAGEAFLNAAGLTTLPVTTFIVAIQIWQASESALQSATIGRQLESLYGSIESDPFLKVTERALGNGDPIPVTKENVEHVWRKILMSNSWRELFKAYVTSELGQTWPETSYWERWTLPGNNIEDAALIENQQDYKGYIAGLLRTLNDLAKKRESAFLMRKYIGQLQSKFQKLNPEQILRKYVNALQQLPKVRAFIRQCPKLIKSGLEDQNPGPLLIVIDNSKNYAMNILAFLPMTGRLGDERKALMAKLKEFYSKAWVARDTVTADKVQEAESEAQNIGEGNVRGPSTGAYHARRVPFTLTFDSLQGVLEAEYLTTGKTEKTQSEIDDEFRQVKEKYLQQKTQAKLLYTREQARKSVPINYTYPYSYVYHNNYLYKLSKYELIDQLLYDKLMARVHNFVGTLRQGTAAQKSKIFDLYDQILKDHHSFSSKFEEITKLFTPYGLQDGRSLPNINYIGLLEFRLPPGNIDETNLDPYNFTFPILKHLDTLNSNIISSIGSYANSFILDIDKMSEISEDFYNQKTSIIRCSKNTKELISKVQKYYGKKSIRIDRIHNSIEYYSKASKDAQKMLEPAKSFLNNLPAIRQSIKVAADNLDKDLSYLVRLRKPLNLLEKTLFNFRSKYQNSYKYKNSPIYTSLKHNHYLFNPKIIDTQTNISCSSLDHSPTLLTPEDIKQILQNLQAQLQQIGIVWLDQRYNIGLTKFIDLYVSSPIIFNKVKDPGHYQFINVGGSCSLHSNEEFDVLLKKIESLKVTRNFPNDINKINKNGHSGLETLRLNLDPNNHLEFATGIAKKSWDPTMAASIQAVINVFASKRIEYFNVGKKEAYFQKQVRKFEDIAARFGSLEYDAKTANNSRSSNDELILLFTKAAAMQPTVERFLAKTSTDPKLTSTGQEYFSVLQPNYQNKFQTINELLKTLSIEKQPAPQSQNRAAEVQAIKTLYAKFRQAYESKNEFQVMRFIDDDWSSADGVTLFDLEDNLRNMYNVFDDIEYRMSGLHISSAGQNLFNISYNVSIRGIIFDNDLTHEEVSAVREQVRIDSDGKPKIVKTLGGNYWSVQ